MGDERDANEVVFAEIAARLEHGECVPAYRLRATQAVLADREAELLRLKGPCSSGECRLHRAHSGPCDIPTPAAQPEQTEPTAGGGS